MFFVELLNRISSFPGMHGLYAVYILSQHGNKVHPIQTHEISLERSECPLMSTSGLSRMAQMSVKI